jgi:hypothetical protein
MAQLVMSAPNITSALMISLFISNSQTTSSTSLHMRWFPFYHVSCMSDIRLMIKKEMKWGRRECGRRNMRLVEKVLSSHWSDIANDNQTDP